MTDTDNDPYLEAILELWPKIISMYQLFNAKKPIMLYDLQDQKVYVYPYQEFKDEMNERSQAILAEQYLDAMQNNKIVIFARDNEKQKLRSYSIEIKEQKPARPGESSKRKPARQKHQKKAP